MIIKKLEVCDFRNYTRANFEFDSGTNVLFGDNAQGKTNVLEAIFVAGTTKSHKGSKDSDMVQMGMQESHIRMHIEKNGILHRVDVHLKKSGSKGIAIDGIATRKSSDLIGMCNLIFFSPEDLAIIKNGPAERRRFLNLELCQLDKMYLYNLGLYNKVLKQRNILLKDIGFNNQLMETLEVWDNQLVKYGKQIIEMREAFILQLNEIIGQIHKNLTGGKEQIVIKYEPDVTSQGMEKKLFMARERDLMTRTTTVGPHRDDILFVVNDKDIRKYGSQGQQRTAALSLKLAEIEIVRKMVKEEPVLLLDDVLSELDRKRQNYLLENIIGVQTILTCTGLEEFVRKKINIKKTFEIENGTVKSME